MTKTDAAPVETSIATISAKHSNERSITAEYDFGANLAECAEKFGDDVVFRNAVQQMTVSLQGFIRTKLGKEGDAKVSDAQIATDVAAWVPGLRQPGKSKVDKAKDLLEGMSEEDRAVLLASLSS